MNRKKILIMIISGLLIVGICTGGGFIYHKNSAASKEVEVMPISYMSGGFYNDGISTRGIVSTDNSQEICVIDKRVVKEVFVKEGDEVKSGDKLLEYDVELLQLELADKKLRIQQSDAKLKSLEKEINKLKATKPIKKVNKISVVEEKNGTGVIRQLENVSKYKISKLDNVEEIRAYSSLDSQSISYDGDGTEINPFRFLCTKDAVVTGEFMNQLMGYDNSGENKVREPLVAMLEVRKNNQKDGELISLWTVNGKEYSTVKKDSRWSLRFMDDEKPQEAPKETPEPDESVDIPVDRPIDEGYTQGELKDKIAEKEEQIRAERVNKKEAELQLKKVEKDTKESIVVAKIDGFVKNLKDVEDVKEREPLMRISGQGGLCIKSGISELKLNEIKMGEKVTLHAWSEDGMQSEGTAKIINIAEYPEANEMEYYMGDGNRNVSYYSFTAVIEGDMQVTSGNYVDVIIGDNMEEEIESIYLSKSYIRKEDGQSFVYIADENNKLIKQFVEVGKVKYGDMTEVKSGLTGEDRIAFPYGKNVREGAKVKDMEENFGF